jgi:acyl-CoA oxidase
MSLSVERTRPSFHVATMTCMLYSDRVACSPETASDPVFCNERINSSSIRAAADTLGRAVTIAVHYSTVPRRADQPRLLDYSYQQYRLLPLIATAYAIHFTAVATRKLSCEVTSRLSPGVPLGHVILDETHATSSGLSTFTTQTATLGIAECRRACNFGYLQSYQTCPVERTNALLTRPTTRYLLKVLKVVAEDRMLDMVIHPLEGPVGCPVGYLHQPGLGLPSKCAATSTVEIMLPSTLLALYAHRARMLLHRTARKLRTAGASSYSHPWQDVATESHAAARAHCAYVLLYHFNRAVTTAPQPLQAVLLRLLQLFALHGCERDVGAFREDGYLSATQAGHVREAVRTLLSQIHPDAVALVDAFRMETEQAESVTARL